LKKVSRNMALADSPDQMRAMQEVFEELRTKETRLASQVQGQGRRREEPHAAQLEVASALGLLKRLRELAGKLHNYAVAKELFTGVNAQMFLRFERKAEKKRKLNKIVGGVVTFGAAPPPLPIYSGPTGRQKIKGPAEPCSAAGPDSQ